MIGVLLSFGADIGVSNNSEADCVSVLGVEPQPDALGLSRQQPPGRPQEPDLLIVRKRVSSSSSSSDCGGLGRSL